MKNTYIIHTNCLSLVYILKQKYSSVYNYVYHFSYEINARNKVWYAFIIIVIISYNLTSSKKTAAFLKNIHGYLYHRA